MNQQPWSFTVVRDQAVLDRISREAKAHMLATMPADHHSAHFKPILNDPNFHIFYHAPALILISAQSPGPWIVEDCALAAQNLMLSAYAAGLGSCWIGFAQSFLNSRQDDCRTASGMCAGGADHRRSSKGRESVRAAQGSRHSVGWVTQPAGIDAIAMVGALHRVY